MTDKQRQYNISPEDWGRFQQKICDIHEDVGETKDLVKTQNGRIVAVEVQQAAHKDHPRRILSLEGNQGKIIGGVIVLSAIAGLAAKLM